MTNESIVKTNPDPTRNVLDLVDAAVKRLDDLAIAETRRVNEIMALNIQHSKELNDKESSRLDSIRQVDVLNQAAAAKSALDAIQALAAQTITNADNIRNTLATTASANAKQVTDLASTIAVQTAATADALSTRIAALEKASAEGIGKGRLADPQMESLLTEVKHLRELSREGTGKSLGANQLWSYLLAGVGLLATAIAIFSRLNN